MSNRKNGMIGRRGLFQTSAAILGGSLLGKNAQAEEQAQVRNVNTNSSPSTLRITDLRVATVGGCAAATENFLALENHSLDQPWWQDLVEGVEKPIINKGYITVPEKPGLGITLNEEACKQHMAQGAEWFAPTPQWDNERSGDWLWSMTPSRAAA